MLVKWTYNVWKYDKSIGLKVLVIKKAHDKIIINIYFDIQKYSKMPRIYIILKCILLKNAKFGRDGFLIFFSKDLVE